MKKDREEEAGKKTKQALPTSSSVSTRTSGRQAGRQAVD